MKIKQKKRKRKKKKTLKITSETMLPLLQSKAVRERCFKRTACKKKLLWRFHDFLASEGIVFLWSVFWRRETYASLLPRLIV
jgi:hypothetical protein